MHPLTVYEIAVREHEHATAERVRMNQQALQRRARTTAVRSAAVRAPRRTWSAQVRSAGARGAV